MKAMMMAAAAVALLLGSGAAYANPPGTDPNQPCLTCGTNESTISQIGASNLAVVNQDADLAADPSPGFPCFGDKCGPPSSGTVNQSAVSQVGALNAAFVQQNAHDGVTNNSTVSQIGAGNNAFVHQH
jgi:hypothetical protein